MIKKLILYITQANFLPWYNICKNILITLYQLPFCCYFIEKIIELSNIPIKNFIRLCHWKSWAKIKAILNENPRVLLILCVICFIALFHLIRIILCHFHVYLVLFLLIWLWGFTLSQYWHYIKYWPIFIFTLIY